MKNILFLVNYPSEEEYLAETALDLAITCQANILLFHTVLGRDHHTGNGQTSVTEAAEEYLSGLTEKLNSIAESKFAIAGFKPNIRYKCVTDTEINITRVISEDLWLILMGTKDPQNPLTNFLFGTNCFWVINRAICPVMIINNKTNMRAVKRIALAMNFETKDLPAVKFLADFSEHYEAQFVLVHEMEDIELELNEAVLKVKPSRARLPKLFYREAINGMMTHELKTFSSNEKFDILGIVCTKGNLFRDIFYSRITMLLLRYPNISMVVFPVSQPY